MFATEKGEELKPMKLGRPTSAVKSKLSLVVAFHTLKNVLLVDMHVVMLQLYF